MDLPCFNFYPYHSVTLPPLLFSDSLDQSMRRLDEGYPGHYPIVPALPSMILRAYSNDHPLHFAGCCAVYSPCLLCLYRKP